MLTLALARVILDGAIMRARAAGSKPVAIVVTDAGGLVVTSAREDNCGTARHDLSTIKARSALALGMPTRTLAAFFEKQPGVHSVLRAATGSDLMPVAGGVIIRDTDENIIGAAGISGGSLEDEETYLIEAIAEVGLRSDPPL